MVLVLASLFIQISCQDSGSISFGVSQLVANEDSNGAFTSVSIPFIREGGSQGNVLVTYQVSVVIIIKLAVIILKLMQVPRLI